MPRRACQTASTLTSAARGRSRRGTEWGGGRGGGGRVTIPAPRTVNFENLDVRFRSGSNRQAHRCRRSSSKIADAGCRRPAVADSHEEDSASWSARRSSSVRSSPSSSATRSTRPFGKGRRLIEDQASLLDMGSERAHVDTVGVSERPGKRSTRPWSADAGEARNHLCFQTFETRRSPTR